MDFPIIMIVAPEPGQEWLSPIEMESKWLRFVRIALCLCFVLGVCTAPVLYFATDGIRTTSSVPPPAVDWEQFTSGKLAKGWERYVKELSPVTYFLRGAYNEARFEAGMLHVPRVIQGKDGWLFLKETVSGPQAAIQHVRPLRRADLKALRQVAEAAGLQVLVVVSPDKTSIYPEHLLPGQMDEPRRGLYRETQDALADAGFAAIDVQALFLAHKQQHPEQLLYYERDTHWRGLACDLVAQAIAQELRTRGWDQDLGPAVRYRTKNVQTYAVPDMVKMLGMRTAVPEGEPSPWSTVLRLQVKKDQLPTNVELASGAVQPLESEHPEAKIAFCGTSYSTGYLQCRLPAELGVAVDTRGVLSGGGTFGGMRKVIAAVVSGQLRPKVLVWEFVERDYLWGWTVPDELAQLLKQVGK